MHFSFSFISDSISYDFIFLLGKYSGQNTRWTKNKELQSQCIVQSVNHQTLKWCTTIPLLKELKTAYCAIDSDAESL